MQKPGGGSSRHKNLGVATKLAIMRKSSKVRVLEVIQYMGYLSRSDLKGKTGTRF